ncbi:hybrid sensor histidine kinase/response regulator [Maribellus mangrovi]|uniref:hybrid sensor histidine kinase/response regulator n=1 Tax=Maribellus mangrovi TaxID=3133146 RepID=UPI0030EF1226
MNTNLGLIRYNGLESKKYDLRRKDSSSVGNDYIECLYIDHWGDLWIGTHTGLKKYNPDCDCVYQYPSKIDNINLTEIRSITEDNNKNIWIGTYNGGLYRYEKESDSFTGFLNNPSDSINVINNRIEHLLVDRNNNLWIGTNSTVSGQASGLVRYNIRTGKVKRFSHNPSNPNSLLDNRICALYEDQNGQLLIGSYKCGFHIYDTKNESIRRMSFDPDKPDQLHAPYTEEKVFGGAPYVQLLHQDQNGAYWIGSTGKGINYFDAATRTVKNYTFNLVNPQLLSSIYEDRQGNLWIGAFMGGGLFKTDLFERKYNLNTSFTNVEVAYESSINPGILWVSTQESGLSRMDIKTGEIKNYLHDKLNNRSLGHNWVRSAYQENKQTLWLGLGNGGPYGEQAGDGGVDRMNLATGKFTHFKLTRNDDGVDDFSYTPYSIVEDREGYLWLGTGPGGIFRSNRDKTEFTPVKVGETDNSSRDIFQNIVRIDSNGEIWASDFAREGTLYLYNREEEKFSSYLKGFKMYNLLIDKKGWLLISTWEKGLIHLNPVDRTIVQYTKKDGLPSNDVVDIVEDGESNYWIGTRMGPAKFNAETGKISSIGLPLIRYNRGILKASDHQIYLSANNGLVSFYPDQVTGNPYPPQVNICELLISEENYLTNNKNSDELILTHKQNDIAFKYTALHYSNPGKNSYQYKLDPIDDKWINAGNERMVRFANLSPGTYNFQVKAANSDGVWSDKTESVQFTIKPAWWRTWLAYIIYLVLAIAFADRFYRFQLSRRLAFAESKRLKEINQVKNTLYTNITHEFRTPLTVINGMTDSIKTDLENKQFADTEKSLQMIKRNSKGLLQLVNEMLDLAKIESGNMKLALVQTDVVPFVKYMSESFHSLAQKKQINLTVYSEVDELIMDFDSKKLSAVISNLLSNAIKFTPPEGKIIVHLNQITKGKNEFFCLKIKDNGPGIPKEEIDHIFNRFYQVGNSSARDEQGTGIGLALSKEFVELMGGSIRVESDVEKGCTFIIEIPVSNKAEKVKENKVELADKIISSSYEPAIVEQTKTDTNLPLVLIIEDNEDVAYYLQKSLIGKYETIHAKNGIEGIEMATSKIPDIIISDVMMPGKDGFEVCATLKSDELTDHIPIILLTAKAAIKDRLAGLSHGADAYLAKPFIAVELFTRLDQLILSRKKLRHKFENTGFGNILNKRVENPETKFLQKVIKIVHANISNHSFGAAQLAHELSLSESQIYRKLKAISGKSTAVFIRSIRLQKGKELIQTTDDTISEIAYEVGFNDPAWFSRAFKEEFGFAPSAMSK